MDQECSCDPVNFIFYNYTDHKLIITRQNLGPPAWKVHSQEIRLYNFLKTRNPVEKHPEMVLEGGCLRWVGASNWPVEHSRCTVDIDKVAPSSRYRLSPCWLWIEVGWKMGLLETGYNIVFSHLTQTQNKSGTLHSRIGMVSIKMWLCAD